MHPYLPHTGDDIRCMLERCGVTSIDDLYADVPESLRMKASYNLPEAKSEKEVRDYFDELAAKNKHLTCFAGAGFYEHHTPAVISALSQRSEFLTAYTPYQPEVSQGTLQYIFEYQSMIAALTGMDATNASMYDGATATAEAMLMAAAAARGGRKRVLISATLAPAVREVVGTYAANHGVPLTTLPEDEKFGTTSRLALEEALSAGDVAGVIVATPNFYGILEDFTGWAELCHQHKALLIMHTNPSALGIIRTPGEWGADIATGDGQSLGMPLSYGGPYLGFIACRNNLIRKLPGRIVGATKDASGQRCFVLTLQAREQHIRRDKATSNICSNQGLMALHAAIYLSAIGSKGLLKICRESRAGAEYLRNGLADTGRLTPRYPESPTLAEWVMTANVNLDDLIERCCAAGILPGVKIGEHEILIAVTEMQTRREMDRYIEIVKSIPMP